MINQIIYSTKPTAYQMKLTFFKDQLVKQAACSEGYPSFKWKEEFTLESVISDYRNSYETLNTTKVLLC
jgi:hypothetical protein